MKYLYMAFHVVQWKYIIMYKNIPLLLFIAWFWKREDIPHNIPNHMLMALIIVGLDGYFWLTLPSNTIKLGTSYILGECLLYISLLLEGLRA